MVFGIFLLSFRIILLSFNFALKLVGRGSAVAAPAWRESSDLSSFYTTQNLSSGDSMVHYHQLDHLSIKRTQHSRRTFPALNFTSDIFLQILKFIKIFFWFFVSLNFVNFSRYVDLMNWGIRYLSWWLYNFFKIFLGFFQWLLSVLFHRTCIVKLISHSCCRKLSLVYRRLYVVAATIVPVVHVGTLVVAHALVTIVCDAWTSPDGRYAIRAARFAWYVHWCSPTLAK